MTKAELVKQISDATGAEKSVAMAVVESFMETVKDSISKGEAVYLRGFGTFDIKHRAQKAARNITRNTTIIVPEHDVPSFKPCKEFMANVKK